MTETDTFITGLAKRDITAFRRLYQCYYKSLVLFALRFIEDVPTAEDVVEEIFISLWENRNTFSDKRSLEGYVYNAVRNKCVNLLRHKNIHSRYVEEFLNTKSEFIDSEKAHRFEMQYIRLFEEIDALPPRPHEVMLLYLEGMSNAEIAEKLSLSIETVKTHRKRALALLRERIQNVTIFIFFLHCFCAF